MNLFKANDVLYYVSPSLQDMRLYKVIEVSSLGYYIIQLLSDQYESSLVGDVGVYNNNTAHSLFCLAFDTNYNPFDYIISDQPAIPNNDTYLTCNHSWALYESLISVNHNFEYCTICDEKRCQ